eukprot:362159-Chlamydomonas_euryale.AAC.2
MSVDEYGSSRRCWMRTRSGSEESVDVRLMRRCPSSSSCALSGVSPVRMVWTCAQRCAPCHAAALSGSGFKEQALFFCVRHRVSLNGERVPPFIVHRSPGDRGPVGGGAVADLRRPHQ